MFKYLSIFLSHMKYLIVVGSHRAKSQSSKVGKYIAQEIKAKQKSVSVSIIDLRLNPLPLWDESKWKKGSKLVKQWAPYSKRIQQADALVIISPEWSGMVPAGLKNFFLLCDKHELAHKPALLVGVSASRGGAYPVAELRMSSYKNTFICYLPEHIIVRNVEKVLNDTKLNKDDKDDKDDYYIKKRLSHALTMLSVYGKAFQKIRKSKKIDLKTYPFGM
jgi:NAD(P)H-dependent FMN reductase